ncbi:DUF1775 domain-containing protein [Micromonospora sp. PLK6-60]|uniref:YcnI family protein n=1 Tax=Micromonospora sp. PLK6-60 TaxID=2873383 RepID=UPI001CA6BAD3|nr:YcnI family protein [Micromonospora sp. PLK6-60]MBY8875380.1 DUF1775 domain-containing protein [Micromonospora sp. PLK6-60]
MTRTRGRGRVRAAAALAAAVVGALAGPGAALADVTVSPDRAQRGGAAELTFVVPEERAGSRTEKIEVRLPAAAPIAEVFPMSVPGWGPQLTYRKLDTPMPGIHGGQVDSVTASVIWTRGTGAPAGPARLGLSLGPLPETDRLAFEVIQTYADGTVVRWADPAGGERPAPALALAAAPPGAPGHDGGGTGPGMSGHDTGGTGPGTGGHDAGLTGPESGGHGPAVAGEPDGARPAGGDGPSADLLLGGGLLAGLGGGAVLGWAASRWRRRPETDGGGGGEPATADSADSARTDPTATDGGPVTAAPADSTATDAEPATAAPAGSTATDGEPATTAATSSGRGSGAAPDATRPEPVAVLSGTTGRPGS